MMRGFLLVKGDISRMDSGFVTEGFRVENDNALTNFPLTSSPQTKNRPAYTAAVCSAYSLAQRSIATCCFEFPILSRNALAAFKVSSESL